MSTVLRSIPWLRPSPAPTLNPQRILRPSVSNRQQASEGSAPPPSRVRRTFSTSHRRNSRTSPSGSRRPTSHNDDNRKSPPFWDHQPIYTNNPVVDAAAPSLFAAVHAQLTHLLATTAWRVTPNGGGLERLHLFPTAEGASLFANRVATLGRTLRHTPEMAGCGRVVYVRWSTRRRLAGVVGTDIAAADIAAAKACVAEAADLGETSTVMWARETGEEEREKGDEEEQLWPIWKVMERQERREPYDVSAGKISQLAVELGQFWRWVRGCSCDQLDVSLDVAGQDPLAWPAWAMVYGMACVSQTRWAVVQKDKAFSLVLKKRRKATANDPARMKELTEAYPREYAPTTKALKGLLKEVVGEFRAL